MKAIRLAAVAFASVALLSACTASDEPALEKGQPAGEAPAVEAQDVKAVPAECGEAFDHAVDISDHLADALEISADAVMYAIDLDYNSLDQANLDLEALVQPLQDARDDYDAAAATCKLAEPPQVCTDALGSAEEVDDLLSQGLDSASRSLEYAVDLNTAGLEEETALVEDLTEDVKVARDDFLAQSTSCETHEGA